MLTSKARNKFGQVFIMMASNEHQTRILHDDDEIIVNATIHQMIEGWNNWQIHRMLIQDAFPFLHMSEREFLMTGLTQEKWNAMIEGVDH